ncbi:uncharacterized protein C17orf80 homolog [Phodopus roborovskii]|uniref:D11Wsu47e protein n=1 Tax=Phodopus roborovskii TaxID=109678 RepID=A0AAU9YML5_PHORO|nr:uncharacterized protein C17orf80 homolog [Phodopus roborovskii]XP_051035803.1 uncharacterized protein C17orf80 homolog [Phodopus roborovskii]XP_051035811.1 uncharacterized protein C17orf80 homolog [Phodopus roborovskii]XP_051035819.1 uncharacterized protein C17orf80 homolog [Phodopus roborovskii]CAH6776368.1 D11Wsu47e [Phodopus roborovskii]
MGDAGPRMEVCPHCKKPFKRLKSHLPHCKMIGSPTSADQKVYQSKPATLPHAKKETRPTRDLTRAEGKEREMENAKRNAKSAEGRPEWTAATFPLPGGVLERAGTTEAGREASDQNQPSFEALRHAKIKVVLQRGTAPQARASDATSPKREPDRDVTESKGSPRHPSETKASLLVGSMEPASSNEGKKYPSVAHHAKPAISASLKLDTVDPQRQKLLTKLLDVPVSDCYSPKNDSHGVQGGRPSMLIRKGSSHDGDHLSGVPLDPGKETQEKSKSLFLGLHNTPLGKAQVREHQEHGQTKGNPATELQEQACLSRGAKDPILPPKAKTQAALALLDVFTPAEGTSSKLLSVPETGHQHLASLAVKSPEDNSQFCGQSQVPTITLLVGSKRDGLEPTAFRQPHAAQTGYHIPSYSAPYPGSKSSLVSHVAADSGAAPGSVGLEWFPELYPGYVGLGVLPRGPQHWNSMAQMPLPVTSQGASVSKVPWWGRSSADSRSSGPLALTASSFPLMRLLGAVHKGWVRCNTTVRKSGVGGLTMLFAGYFILCCSWSFKHLKLQRWRK